jgi:hypothetical protein
MTAERECRGTHQPADPHACRSLMENAGGRGRETAPDPADGVGRQNSGEDECACRRDEPHHPLERGRRAPKALRRSGDHQRTRDPDQPGHAHRRAQQCLDGPARTIGELRGQRGECAGLGDGGHQSANRSEAECEIEGAGVVIRTPAPRHGQAERGATDRDRLADKACRA